MSDNKNEKDRVEKEELKTVSKLTDNEETTERAITSTAKKSSFSSSKETSNNASTKSSVASVLRNPSYKTTKSDYKDLFEPQPSTQSFKKTRKKEKIIIPIEDWPTKLTNTEMVAYRQYKQQEFPELFETKKCEDDKASEVPCLALTKPARIFSALLETSIKFQREEKKKKLIH
jgi:hypothetical protein